MDSLPCCHQPDNSTSLPSLALDPKALDHKFSAARAMLVAQYNLEAAFVGVPKLARILGCSPTTIWNYIRQGKFFIPYRMINGSPMVTVCDLAHWYCSTSEMHFPAEAGRWPIDAGGFDEVCKPKPARASPGGNQAKKLVEEAFAAMGIKGKQRNSRQ